MVTNSAWWSRTVVHESSFSPMAAQAQLILSWDMGFKIVAPMVARAVMGNACVEAIKQAEMAASAMSTIVFGSSFIERRRELVRGERVEGLVSCEA